MVSIAWEFIHTSFLPLLLFHLSFQAAREQDKSILSGTYLFVYLCFLDWLIYKGIAFLKA